MNNELIHKKLEYLKIQIAITHNLLSGLTLTVNEMVVKPLHKDRSQDKDFKEYLQNVGYNQAHLHKRLKELDAEILALQESEARDGSD